MDRSWRFKSFETAASKHRGERIVNVPHVLLRRADLFHRAGQIIMGNLPEQRDEMEEPFFGHFFFFGQNIADQFF